MHLSKNAKVSIKIVPKSVIIEGAKWCGKTSTASKAAKSMIFMQDPDNAISYHAMADTKPSLLLKGATDEFV